jgi:hypothetical protein
MGSDGDEVVSLRRQPLFTPRKFPGTYFCYRLSRPQGHSAAERMRSTETSDNLIGNRIRNLPACSTMIQPSTLPRTSIVLTGLYFFSLSPWKTKYKNYCYNPSTMFRTTLLHILLHILMYPYNVELNFQFIPSLYYHRTCYDSQQWNYTVMCFATMTSAGD